ncbi:hypothetical protein RFI_12181 [Reticulomyxa filosa]|uniref:Uncharacterized protein n=1 Tax=Reticulomyxa filosa TaxID=46433 RepID=X6NHZ6_RETFI|nr:hypothetical protein RFI_12181 [Reticulomyxa filosa]|eukprot:ETO24962.1 hypothetical protein RFI_12181 [Reticulomyxa filosa]
MFPCYFVCLLILVLILVVHLYKISKKQGRSGPHNNSVIQQPFRTSSCQWLNLLAYSQLIDIFSVLALLAGCGCLLANVLPYHQFKLQVPTCDRFGPSGQILYLVHKCFIYECLIIRLQSSFVGSVYTYNAKMMQGLHVLNVSLIILFSVGLCTEISGKHKYEVTKASNGGYICVNKNSFSISSVIVVVDVIMNVVLLVLFVKPLYALSKKSKPSKNANAALFDYHHNNTHNNNNDKNNNDQSQIVSVSLGTLPPFPPVTTTTTSTDTTTTTTDVSAGGPLPWVTKQSISESKSLQHRPSFFELTTKVSILTLIMTLSTLFSILLLALLKWTVFVMFDVVINCSCLLLVFKQYDPIYRLLCKCCLHPSCFLNNASFNQSRVSQTTTNTPVYPFNLRKQPTTSSIDDFR